MSLFAVPEYSLCFTFQVFTLASLTLAGSHCEWRKGSHDQCVTYCNKPFTRVQGPWTLQVETHQGERSDLKCLAAMVTQEHLTDFEIASQYPDMMLRFGGRIRTLRSALAEPTTRDFVDTFVIHGPTGLGKSHFVFANFPFLKNSYRLNYGAYPKLWFDGYTGQETLYIDEFIGSLTLVLTNLLRVRPKLS